MRLDSITSTNPTPTFTRPSSMALCHARPASLGFPVAKMSNAALPTGLGFCGLNLRHRSIRNRTLFAFAASHEDDSKDSEVNIKKEKEDLASEAKESQEAWQEALAAFKEQALRMQNVSKEAYEVYSEKAVVVLKETSERLKIQAEKAREDLTVIANEIAEESQEYFAIASEKAPEPVKDIIETYTSSSDEFKDVSKLQDFHVGIPYGALLSLGGFLSFMLNGSIPAIRFGIILGGTLLALSISSLRHWKSGESSPAILKGQTAIATVLFLRELSLLSTRPFIINFFTTLISGGVAAFFLYRIMRDGGLPKRPKFEADPQN